MSDKYILIGKTPVPEPNLIKWGRWFETHGERIVKQEWVGKCWVSTIFLGLDHHFFGPGPPLLFETMTFEDGAEQDCKRCSTWAEAEAQHVAMVAKVQEAQRLTAVSDTAS